MQTAIVEWCAWNKHKYPELRLLYATPNQGVRSQSERASRQREGMKAGVPDLCLPVPRGQFGSLYIELKTRKGKTSLPQKEYLKLLTKFGNLAVVCFSSSDAIKIITQYLGLNNENNNEL